MFKKLIKSNSLNLSILFFGVSFCSTFVLTNLSSTFRFLGVSEYVINIAWIIPPVTGLFIQPIIGKLSDNTKTPWGKRKPYIFAWGVLAVLAMLFFPLSVAVPYVLFCMFVINCSLNGASESIRALTGDVCNTRREKTRAFALQGIASALGGSAGAYLPYAMQQFLHYRLKHPGVLPANLKMSFIISGIALLLTLIYALFNLSDEKLPRTKKHRKLKTVLTEDMPRFAHEIIEDIKAMPKDYKLVFLAHSISWIGIFIFWLYISLALAQNIYHLPAYADFASSVKNANALQKASLDSSLFSMIYLVVSVIYAIFLFFLSDNVNSKKLHAYSLLIGGLGVALIFMEHRFFSLALSAVAFGIMWGSLITLPYSIVVESIPKDKIGIYLGIFNIAITVPQLICGLALFPVYSYVFHGCAVCLITLGGILLMISGIFWYKLGQNDAS